MTSLRVVSLLSLLIAAACNPYNPSFQDLKCGPDDACPDGLACVEGVCRGDVVQECGDGVTVGSEVCDDGNTADGDGCDAVCAVATCYVPVTHATLAEALTDTACPTVFVHSGTYRGRFELARDVSVVGVGATPPILDGEQLGSVVSVNAGINATLRRFTIKNGKALAGGGIINRGTLDLDQVLVTENTAEDANPNGGGIENLAGTLILSKSVVSKNRLVTTATTGAVLTGTGIHSTGGTIKLTDESVVEENDINIFDVSGASARGGGIGAINTAITILKKSEVRTNDLLVNGRPGNGAAFGGGVYVSGGTFVIDGESVVANNIAAAEGVTSGGAIGANAAGGGLYATNAALTIVTALFHENKVSARGETGTTALGGGLAVRGGSLTANGPGIIQENIVIAMGLGANSLLATAGGGGVDLESLNPIFNKTLIHSNTVTASTESATSGGVASGGGLRVSSVGTGARAIFLTNATVEKNSVTSNDSSAFGGGVYAYLNNGSTTELLTLSIESTTLSNNKVQSPTNAQGGGVRVNVPDGTGTINVNVSNSTLSANKADGLTGIAGGGGVYAITSGGSAKINLNFASSTITANSAMATTISGGGGLSMASAATPAAIATSMKNTIVADNTGVAANPDCVANSTVTSGGYNLLGVAAGCTFSVTTGHLTGAAGLGPLADNGGFSKTHSLNAGSQAINAGNTAGCTDPSNNAISVDQRGGMRTVGGRCDIGAYEVQ